MTGDDERHREYGVKHPVVLDSRENPLEDEVDIRQHPEENA